MSASPYIFEIDASNYQQIVLDASHEVPVLVDFWATWCQPCQILMPMLARLADEYQGRFILAKINTEEQQAIAAQFGIRSIPTVKLFKNGAPIDEFMGALPEQQIRDFLDKHLPRASDGIVAQAQQLLQAGDSDSALALLLQAQADDPSNTRVAILLAQLHAARGDAEAANTILDGLPADIQSGPEVTTLRGHLHFQTIVTHAPAGAELERRLEANPNDSEARFQLAAYHVLGEDYIGAMELLLTLMQKDRSYGDDAARTTLLRLFDSLGEAPEVASFRRRMFNLLH